MSQNDKRRSQRTLVLQGGGSLGAYEAGVFHVLYHWIKKDLSIDENIFDIVAGTSIGAINASIIVNEILEKKELDLSNKKAKKTLKYWEDTPEKLIRFWKNVSANTVNPWDPWNLFDLYRSFVENYLRTNYEIYLKAFPYLQAFLPTVESFRRYYHTQMSLAYGERHIFSPLFIYPLATPVPNKFFDYYSPTSKWYQYSNVPLRKSIVDSNNSLKYNDTTGIKTIYDEREPRLLLVAVDIKDAKTTTFDSYKENISINHVLASAAVPKNYPYIEIDGNKYWDGGILSNTPVREVLSEHSKFWTERLGYDSDSNSSPEKWTSYENEKKWFENNDKKSIPKLELCIVNLYPSKEEGEQIPTLLDYDLTKDRENDIRFHDKTEYDIKMAKVVSDYKDFVENMGQLTIAAIEEIKNRENIANKLKQSFIEILNKKQRTLTRDERPRFFYDLIRKRFDIINVIEIQRQDDIHTIANKAFDFSAETISNLIEQGIMDTLDRLYQDQKEKSMYNKELIMKFKEWLINYIRDTNSQSTREIQRVISDFKKKERL
jgi:NTE family protein